MVLDFPLQEDPENHSRVLDVVVVGGIAENEISGLVRAAILNYVELMPTKTLLGQLYQHLALL